MLKLCRECLKRIGLGSEGECVVCGGIFERTDEIADRILSEIGEYEFESFDIGIRLYGSINAVLRFLREKYGIQDRLKEELRKRIVDEVSSVTGKRRRNDCDIRIIFSPEDMSIETSVRSVYIYGRYIKRVRELSQTRWICRNCNGKGCEVCGFQGKKYLSVEELIISPALRFFQGKNGFLHGAGREDVDARMLGTGRPFILEISRPKKRNVDLNSLEEIINREAAGKIAVRFLAYAKPGDVARLKSAKFSKVYRAVVRFSEPVDEDKLCHALKKLENSEINQRTPKRVEHRRADKVRKRRVYSAKLILKRERVAVVEIHGESGLYIKELVSGDEGRTRPSLSELLDVECHVERLDVVEIKGGLEDGNLKYTPSPSMFQRR
mgnify:CR=1 FL=1